MKKELIDLLENIKEKFGYSREMVSEMAGYMPSYITFSISKNTISKKLMVKVREVAESKNSDNHITDADTLILNNQAEILAATRVIFSILAEIHAAQAGRLPTDLLHTYRKMVRDEAAQIRQESKQK
jgi:hypothetical protein